MTSSNVYFIQFRNEGGHLLHQERVHLLTKKKWDYEAIQNLPLNGTFVSKYWPDDETEEDESYTDIPMTEWLEFFTSQHFRNKLLAA